MKKVTITLPLTEKKSYTIYVGTNLLETITTIFDFSQYSRLFIITDETIKPLFLERLQKNLPVHSHSLVLPSGEKAKTIKSITKIWAAMQDAKLDRKSLVLNLGGGVISDMGGFGAATFMRGVDFINIPTTLLAQVDATIGGKTGFDFGGVKNLIGNFTQPKAVIIDVTTLQTLPQRAFLAGFAEIIKHGMILNKDYFKKVTSKKPLEFTETELIDIIKESCEIKATIIEKDEKEGNKRKILNFGHTIGHAVEALSLETQNPLLHGEAISIGMTIESQIAAQSGLLRETTVQLIKEKLQATGLPVTLPKFEREMIIDKM